ncbi:hypothetical protein BJF88_11255 [Cellulosimicrobium sp. CUA-896]|nr:hypothetical protein [Cellulosimicrobium sp. CUA-896]OLT53474.1 hypothetical protein BJF88_11255 [Cellulosimicrobium sp. CUA-896]
MDAPVAALGQQGPCRPVQDEARAGEEEGDEQDAAHDERVDAEALGDPGGDAADPAVVGPGDAGATDGVEEAVGARRAVARVGRRS